MIRYWALSLAAALGCVFAPAARAADGAAVYALKLRGITAGELTIEANEADGRYAVAALIRSVGLVSAFRRFSYRGRADGQRGREGFRPERYLEAADTGRRSSEAELAYEDGVPRVVHYASPRAAAGDTPDPATQGGTVDPLTGIYAMLRDVTRDEACRLDLFMFDGRRRSRIAMQVAGEADGLPYCAGIYQRLEGFTERELARHRKFDFVLTYRAGPGERLQVERVEFASLYGVAAIDRR